jgi:FlaA1/EpsC-like NDP-sugar epimerase
MMDTDNLSFFDGKRVLVTGACGTVGRELSIQILREYPIQELICMDNNESDLFFLERQLQEHPRVSFSLGDVRDRKRLVDKMNHVDFVFHTAAYKHVTVCERSPFEAVQTNIIGVQNIISSAIENEVKKVIFTSSDKAVNPTNVMGTSKLMGEKLITAANSNVHGKGPVFASTRFGNVLGSRGSVIPVFREQIRGGGPVTLTSIHMTRFIMSIQESVRLIIDSMRLSLGGEVFITKMPAIRIEDLAQVMIRNLAPVYGYRVEEMKIKEIGVFPGEKMYEELMSAEETRRAWELKRYFVVMPAFTALYRKIAYDYPEIVSKEVKQPYHSGVEKVLSKEDLEIFLKTNTLIQQE